MLPVNPSSSQWVNDLFQKKKIHRFFSAESRPVADTWRLGPQHPPGRDRGGHGHSWLNFHEAMTFVYHISICIYTIYVYMICICHTLHVSSVFNLNVDTLQTSGDAVFFEPHYCGMILKYSVEKRRKND